MDAEQFLNPSLFTLVNQRKHTCGPAFIVMSGEIIDKVLLYLNLKFVQVKLLNGHDPSLTTFALFLGHSWNPLFHQIWRQHTKMLLGSVKPTIK